MPRRDQDKRSNLAAPSAVTRSDSAQQTPCRSVSSLAALYACSSCTARCRDTILRLRQGREHRHVMTAPQLSSLVMNVTLVRVLPEPSSPGKGARPYVIEPSTVTQRTTRRTTRTTIPLGLRGTAQLRQRSKRVRPSSPAEAASPSSEPESEPEVEDSSDEDSDDPAEYRPSRQ